MQLLDRRNAGFAELVLPELVLNVRWPTHWERIPDPHGRAKPPMATEGRGLTINHRMRAVLKTVDPVVLDYAANLLSQEGIESVVFDTHASVMDGSMGFLPRRLMVLDEDFAKAEKLLRDALPEAM